MTEMESQILPISLHKSVELSLSPLRGNFSLMAKTSNWIWEAFIKYLLCAKHCVLGQVRLFYLPFTCPLTSAACSNQPQRRQLAPGASVCEHIAAGAELCLWLSLLVLPVCSQGSSAGEGEGVEWENRDPIQTSRHNTTYCPFALNQTGEGSLKFKLTCFF